MVLLVYTYCGDIMKRKRIVILGIVLALFIVLAVFAKGESNTNIDSSDVIFDDISYVDSTSNLFTLIGSKVSALLAKFIGYIFIIINKLLEFVFGI